MQTQTDTHPIAQTELDVTGMHCGSCERRIAAALARVPGVARVRVDVPARRVHVEHAPTTPAASLIASIEAEGYAARAI
ncbi:heavy-metal-associated domain-containing protein [Nannocystaceae bacterium ST9]